jgi:hypothetical protein
MKCDNPGCQGHLAKFDSCLAECLYSFAMDENDYTGSSDFGVWCTTPLVFEVDQVEDIDPYADASVTVTIPWGVYLVSSNDQGFVYCVRYETIETAQAEYDRIDVAYSEWCETEGVE